MNKICSLCAKELNFSEFYKDRKSKDKLSSWCKLCTKEYQLQYNKNHVNEKRATNKQWYQDNQDTIKDNMPNKLKNNRNWYIKNRDAILQQRRAHHNGKDRRKNDPLYHLRTNMSALIYSSFKRSSLAKTGKTVDYLGCTIQFFSEYLGPKPPSSHLDHICPCSQAQNEDELRKLQHYTNFQWLDRTENLRKADKWTAEGEQKCLDLLGRKWIFKEEE